MFEIRLLLPKKLCLNSSFLILGFSCYKFLGEDLKSALNLFIMSAGSFNLHFRNFEAINYSTLEFKIPFIQIKWC